MMFLPEVKFTPGDPGITNITSGAASLTLAACAVVQPPHVIGLATSCLGKT